MRRYLADTRAMIIFSIVCGAFIEIVIAGLSFDQSMRIRLSAIPVILFAGDPTEVTEIGYLSSQMERFPDN
ncbi:L-alanine exporter AlaE [Rivularia sp. UHCC 0363]|uniref:L-alanine exporter AlaE n=1 Tax=Rivularia sp. UHCC 0363 TaxID=3110244 RepID=UPI003A59943D